MVFAHDVEAALVATAILVNSVPELSHSGEDEMTTVDELDAFIVENTYTGEMAHDDAELEAVRATREPLRALWLAGTEDELAGILNRMLHEGGAEPRLVRHGQWGWHVHATSDSAPLADRIVVEAAMGWVDVLRSGERERMRVCAADDCEAVLVDLSRNRSKRYCDTGNCGNRANVAAYRARQASGE